MAKLRVERGHGGGGFVGIVVIVVVNGIFRQQQGVFIRCSFVHGDAHVVNHIDDVFDLFGIDDVIGQGVVYLGISEVALGLAVCD